MAKTHTPFIIEGKIYVVVDAPDVPSPLDIHFERKKRIYYSRLSTCTKYETLPEHAPYWEERIGQQVEVVIGQFFKWNDGNYMNTCAVCSERFMHGAKRQPVCKPCCETTYAIPPQQKQGDEWDEAWERFEAKYGMNTLEMQTLNMFNFFKSEYNLTKK